VSARLYEVDVTVAVRIKARSPLDARQRAARLAGGAAGAVSTRDDKGRWFYVAVVCDVCGAWAFDGEPLDWWEVAEGKGGKNAGDPSGWLCPAHAARVQS